MSVKVGFSTAYTLSDFGDGELAKTYRSVSVLVTQGKRGVALGFSWPPAFRLHRNSAGRIVKVRVGPVELRIFGREAQS